MNKTTIKRIFAGLLCSFAVMSSLSGCGGEAQTTDTTADTAAEQNAFENTDGLTEVKGGPVSPGVFYQNPLEGSAADPMIVKHEDTYYLYSTGGTQLSVRSSKNLLTWGDKKTIFKLSQTSWGKEKCWAPEVFEYKGKFYLFFCGTDKNTGIFHGSVAVCDTPDGTFKPIGDAPLLNFSYSVIDLSFFEDDDGRTYIYYSKDCSTNKINGKKVSQTYAVEVSNDFTKMLCEPVLISTPSESWELKSGNIIWNEGPIVFKENGTYYLLYSANYYQSADYAVGYCTSDSPLKFFDKPKNGSIIKGNGTTITGPGHCNILRMGDEIYLTYHAHTVPPNTDGGRSLYIDKLVVKEDGTLYANGPTNTRQPLPDGVNGYYKYHGDIEITGNVTGEIDLGILRDEMIPKGFTNHIILQDEDTVTFKFPEATKLDLMWIYGTTITANKVASVDVIINGQYLYDDVKFAENGNTPLIISFSRLPEGTLIETIDFKFTKAEGSEGSAIGEVIFSTKK